jgi:dolichol-phosphate mannosyltransferase
MSDTKQFLSIVIPVYCEEDVIGEFYSRLKKALVRLEPAMDSEIVFVDDGSRDRTLPLIQALRRQDESVKVLSLSRNFGHQFAITAGLDHVVGDAVVIIDGDLQDPPEVILEMVAKWREGYKVVFGVREKREGEGIFKRATAKAFYRIMRRFGDVDLPLDAGDFRLIDREVVHVLRALREENRYLRGLVSWCGFGQYGLVYRRDKRYAGKTKFSTKKMIRFAIDGILSFSDKPLKLTSYLGFVITLCSFLMGANIILGKILQPGRAVSGWSSLMVAVLFVGGVQLISLGIIGLYIGRQYRETKRRPLYVIADQKDFDQPPGDRKNDPGRVAPAGGPPR